MSRRVPDHVSASALADHLAADAVPTDRDIPAPQNWRGPARELIGAVTASTADAGAGADGGGQS